MKAQVKVNPFIIVDVEGATVKDLFGAIGDVQEILSEKACGLCKSANIRFKRRPAKDKKGKPIDYYECVCGDCGARLSYGQSMDKTSLFPKRKLTPEGEPNLETGSFGPHNGWTKWKWRGEPKD